MSKAGALRNVMAYVPEGAAPDEAVAVPAEALRALEAAIRSDRDDAERVSIDRADVGDVYVSPDGRLWSVTGRINEPSVTMRSLVTDGSVSEQLTGGVSGMMWDGFRRLRRA